ncbi:hypothetical protein HDU86_000554 [Geranomyces michiganensis]|nr:hypothetical protein HDU86_000554 [Geranomyces michiganensis]
MTWWPLFHDGLHAFAATPLLAFLHAVGVAFSLKKSFPYPWDRLPFLQGLLSHLLVALGGGTIVATLTARPVPILTSNLVLPLYTAGYLLVNYVPGVYPLLRKLGVVWGAVFAALDGSSRAWAMCAGLDAFRSHANYGHLSKDAVVGQLVVGVLSVTAGGIALKWGWGYGRWTWPGWDFGVVCAVTAGYVAYGDVSHGLGSLLRIQLRPLAPYQKQIGMRDELSHAEVRTVCAVLMTIGFLIGQWRSARPARAVSLSSPGRAPTKKVAMPANAAKAKGKNE